MERSEQCQVYRISDIQAILKIQKSAACHFIKSVHEAGGPFRVVKIGAIYRIPRMGFHAWLNGGNTQGETAVYDMKQIQDILDIKRTAAYSLVAKVYESQEPFRILKIGSLYRIPCTGFDQWLNEQ